MLTVATSCLVEELIGLAVVVGPGPVPVLVLVLVRAQGLVSETAITAGVQGRRLLSPRAPPLCFVFAFAAGLGY